MKSKLIILGAMMLLLALALAACQPAPAPTAAPVEQKPCPTAAPCPECPACPPAPEPVVEVVPFEEAWAGSGHNDAEAEAFVHWNEADPAEVPTNCAKCHTSAGYTEFLTNGKIEKGSPGSGRYDPMRNLPQRCSGRTG